MIRWTFTQPHVRKDVQPNGSFLWWVVVNGWILAYCDTEAEAEAVAKRLSALVRFTALDSAAHEPGDTHSQHLVKVAGCAFCEARIKP